MRTSVHRGPRFAGLRQLPLGHACRVIASLRDRLTPPLDALRQIAANAGLLRLELGSLTFSAADGMVVIGLAVLAYEEGGTTTVAVLAIIRALPSVVLVPYLLARTNTMAR